jgi:carboxyl-terminal processing protease
MTTSNHDPHNQPPGPDDRFGVSEPIEEGPPAFQPGRQTRVAIWILAALGFFLLGVLVDRTVFDQGQGLSSITDPSSGSSDDLDKIGTVLNYLEDEYYYRPDPEASGTPFADSLVNGALEGMTSGLGDDYTVYLEPVEQAPIAEQMSGEYEGIGVWVDYPDGKVRIIAPMPGSPAERAGLLPNDILVAADGVPLAGLTGDDTLGMIRGPAGTTVTLTVAREGSPDPIDLVVERAKITTPSVLYTRVGENGQYGLIQITIFGDNTTEQLDRAIEQAQADGVTGIILDVRNNGGGWVETAQQVIGRFVSPEHGPALFEDVNPNDDELSSAPILAGETSEYTAPVVVLVNGGTASAAEIVAGALQDYDRAIVIGDTTFGKGTVQRVHNFDDGSSLRITFAQWLTPSQAVIQGVGIPPSIAVADNLDTEADEQLDTAIAVLSGEPLPVASPVGSPMASPVATPALEATPAS